MSDRSTVERPTLRAWLLACLFLGITGVGGGLSILGQAGDRFVRRRWTTEAAWTRTAAVAQLLPGGPATNALADLGRSLFGLGGALLSVLVYVAPSSALMIVLGLGAGHAGWLEPLRPALNGVAAGVVGLVAAVTLRLGRAGVRRPWQLWPLAASLLLQLVGGGIAAGVAAGLLIAGGHELWRMRSLRAAALRRRQSRAGPPQSAPPLPSVPPFALLAVPAGAIAWSAPPLAALFLVFAKVGALSFGGGYAIVPLLHAEALGHGWADEAGFAQAFALAQVTPGPVLVCASFLGARAEGVWGGVAASLGVFLVPAVLVARVGGWLEEHRSHRPLRAALRGLLPAVVGAMVFSVFHLGQAALHGTVEAVLAAAVLGVAATRAFDPVLALALAGGAGALLLR